MHKYKKISGKAKFKWLRLLYNSSLFVKLPQVAYHHERSISWFSPVHGRNILGGHNDNVRRCPSMAFHLHSKITQTTLCNLGAIRLKNFVKCVNNEPISVAAQYMAWAYDRLLAGVLGSNPTPA